MVVSLSFLYNGVLWPVFASQPPISESNVHRHNREKDRVTMEIIGHDIEPIDVFGHGR